MTDLSQKYDFLLRPIKDLTKNWNVDIAAVLEDFRDELEKMTFSFDGGKTKLNFAEAALLIQGTACVWSRKVESLYNLVYQTLEMIMNNKHNKQPSSINPQGLDNDATFDDHEEKFLNLDDVKTVVTKKLSESGERVVCMSQKCPFFQKSAESRGSPFLNKDGEVSNYYNDFWTNNLIPQSRGIALLEFSIETADKPRAEKENESTPVEAEAPEDIDNPADDFLDFDDDNEPATPPVQSPTKDVPEVVEEFQNNLRSLRSHRLPPPITQTVSLESPSENDQLDPHTVCQSWKAKPFKKGKTIKLPPSLEDNQKKRKRTPQALADTPFLTDFLNSARKLVSAGESKFVKDEKQRRNERWKVLKMYKLQQNIPDSENRRDEPDEVERDNPDFDDDVGDDVPDVDDLIDDVTVAGGDVQPFCDLTLDTYEDLVRHHVELFYSSAKRYVQESALSQRVKEWQELVEPRLSEQDNRPEFDIHKYGDDVLESFDCAGDSKMFGSCVRGETRWSVCRAFAAVLQLANDQSVLLSTSHDDLQESINSLQLRLLNQDKRRKAMEENLPG